jgi:hypothetical protein
MNSGFFLVHFHSTNRVCSHDASVLKWIYSTSLQKSFRSFQFLQITDPACFSTLKNLFLTSSREISSMPRAGCTHQIKPEPTRTTETHESASRPFCISCAHSVDNPPLRPPPFLSHQFPSQQNPLLAGAFARYLHPHPASPLTAEKPRLGFSSTAPKILN